MCIVLLWGIWGEGNNMVFRGIERESLDVWTLERFVVSLLALVRNSSCNYTPCFILLGCSPFYMLMFSLCFLKLVFFFWKKKMK